MEPVGVSESQSNRYFQLFGSVLGTASITSQLHRSHC
nr:MAG TPA: hypothetical protein [Caudoviricetes sp.]